MADTVLMETIGKNIKRYREKAHLTQAELAELVGVENAFISRVERGQKLMKLKTLLALAEALHVSADLLLYQESQSAQIHTLVLMLEGQSPEFIDSIGNVKKCAVGKHPKSEKLGSTGQAACCARIHSRYFTGGSPSGLRV